MLRTLALSLVLILAPLAAAQPAAPAQTPATTTPPASPTKPETTPDGKVLMPTGPKGKRIAFPLDLYDESADGATQIRDAIARARTDNRRVLVMWGENYCGFCSELHDLLTWEDPRLRTLVASEYEFVKIDLGKGFFKTNHLDLAHTYGADVRAGGSPALSIIDPGTGKSVAALDGKAAFAKPMTMQRVYDEQKLFGFLSDNRPVAKIAMTVFSEQLVFAGRAGKKLLVWFGEPECAGCAELHRWFTDPAVAAALAPGFLVLKIDPQRMTTGRMVMDRVTGKPGAPCPFIAVVDSLGKPINAQSLIEGYPLTPEQRSALRSAIASNAPAIDAAALDAALAKLPAKPAEASSPKAP